MSSPGNPAPAENGFFYRGGAWVIGQSVLMIAVGIMGPATGVRGSIMLGWCGIISVLFTLLGAYFGIGGVVALGGGRTVFPRPVDGAKLIRSGVYGLVQHPLYTSLLCLGIAWSIWWRSWQTAAATLLMTLFLMAKARREEAWLRERFGAEYLDYQSKVRRLVPWIY